MGDLNINPSETRSHLTRYILNDTIILKTLVIRRMNMKRRIFTLLAIIGFVVLMLCSCSNVDCYNGQIKMLEDKGFVIVGNKDDVVEFAHSLINDLIDDIVSSQGNGSGLVEDPYNQGSTTESQGNLSSGLIDDPYNQDCTEVPQNYSLTTPTNDIAIPISTLEQIINPGIIPWDTDKFVNPNVSVTIGSNVNQVIGTTFSVNADHIVEAVLMENSEGEKAFVVLYNNSDSAFNSTILFSMFRQYSAYTAGPWFGEATVVTVFYDNFKY